MLVWRYSSLIWPPPPSSSPILSVSDFSLRVSRYRPLLFSSQGLEDGMCAVIEKDRLCQFNSIFWTAGPVWVCVADWQFGGLSLEVFCFVRIQQHNKNTSYERKYNHISRKTPMTTTIQEDDRGSNLNIWFLPTHLLLFAARGRRGTRDFTVHDAWS